MGVRTGGLLRGGVLGLVLVGCVERGTGDSEAGGGSTGAGEVGTSTSGEAPGHSTTTGASTGGPTMTGGAATEGAGETTGDATDGASSGEVGEESSGGTTGTGGTTGGVMVIGFEADIWPIVAPNCGCHFDGEGGPLELAKSSAYENLVGQQASQAPKMLRVTPGSAEDSYLWHKLNNTQKSVGGTGKRMPPGGALEPAELDLIALWIDEGAAP